MRDSVRATASQWQQRHEPSGGMGRWVRHGLATDNIQQLRTHPTDQREGVKAGIARRASDSPTGGR